MNLFFILGQVMSILAFIMCLIVAQFKEVKHILFGEITANLFTALSYFFLGGNSGAWVCIVATLQTFVVYLLNQREVSETIRNKITIIFGIIYIVGTIVVFQGWADIVCCLCAMLYIMAITQQKGSKYRVFMAGNCLLWVIYDIYTLAFLNLITHGSKLVSLVIAMVRLDRKHKIDELLMKNKDREPSINNESIEDAPVKTAR